jgi:hypothetical protein
MDDWEGDELSSNITSQAKDVNRGIQKGYKSLGRKATPSSQTLKHNDKQKNPNKKKKLTKYQKVLKRIYNNPDLLEIYEVHRYICTKKFMNKTILAQILKGSIMRRKRYDQEED